MAASCHRAENLLSYAGMNAVAIAAAMFVCGGGHSSRLGSLTLGNTVVLTMLREPPKPWIFLATSSVDSSRSWAAGGAVLLTSLMLRSTSAMRWNRSLMASRQGDILLTHNATVGRVAIVGEKVEEFLLGTSVTFYRVDQEVIYPPFLYFAL